jgi:hypothetical protein
VRQAPLSGIIKEMQLTGYLQTETNIKSNFIFKNSLITVKAILMILIYKKRMMAEAKNGRNISKLCGSLLQIRSDGF